MSLAEKFRRLALYYKNRKLKDPADPHRAFYGSLQRSYNFLAEMEERHYSQPLRPSGSMSKHGHKRLDELEAEITTHLREVRITDPP